MSTPPEWIQRVRPENYSGPEIVRRMESENVFVFINDLT